MTKQVKILFVCTILVLCTLYAAQPIQPLFKSELNLTNFQAVIFTTVIMFPLGIAPILYGYILESFSARSMLLFSMIFLGVLEIIFSLSNTYYILLLLRALQGLVIPAALTSLISYVSITSPPELIQKSIGNYVATTIIGGFLARFLSGFSSQFFGSWKPFFFLIGVLLIIFSFVLSKIAKDTRIDYVKPTVKEIGKVLKVRHNVLLYMSMFFIFFIFQATLNFLPFELKALDGVDEGKIGFIYIGYGIGVLISLNVTSIIKFFKSERSAMIVGVLIYAIGIMLFHISNFWVMLFSMFVFCCGMFTVHSIATGFVNRYAKENKAIANGLYLSFYYSGGTLGTFLPNFIYLGYGWGVLLNLLLFTSFFSLAFLLILKKQSK